MVRVRNLYYKILSLQHRGTPKGKVLSHIVPLFCLKRRPLVWRGNYHKGLSEYPVRPAGLFSLHKRISYKSGITKYLSRIVWNTSNKADLQKLSLYF